MVGVVLGFQIKQERRVAIGTQSGGGEDCALQAVCGLLGEHAARRPGGAGKVIRSIVEKFLSAVRILQSAQFRTGEGVRVGHCACRMSLHDGWGAETEPEEPAYLLNSRSSEYLGEFVRSVKENIRGIRVQSMRGEAVAHGHRPQTSIDPGFNIDMGVADDDSFLWAYAGLGYQFERPFRIRLLGGEAVAAIDLHEESS